MAGRYVKRSRSVRPRPDPPSPSIEQPPTTSPTTVRRGFPEGSTFKTKAVAPPVLPADVPEPPGIEVNAAFFKVIEGVAIKLENVRTELSQIRGMTYCLTDILKYSDDDDAMFHSDVADVATRLLNDVITDLELIKAELPTNQKLARSIMGETDKDVEV